MVEATSPFLIDANVLVYAFDQHAPQRGSCRRVLDAALGGRCDAVLVPQVLFEMFATATSARAQRPASVSAALDRVESLASSLAVLPVTVDSVSGALELARRHPRPGQQVWDLFLVAQMQSHNIDRICTYNTHDFQNFDIEALTPEQLIAG